MACKFYKELNIFKRIEKIVDSYWEEKMVRKKIMKRITERPTDCEFKYLPTMDHCILLLVISKCWINIYVMFFFLKAKTS